MQPLPPQRPIQTRTMQMFVAAAATTSTVATGSRPAAPATLYRAGPEQGGRGPPPGYGAYTRNGVNELPPQTGHQAHPVVERGLPCWNIRPAFVWRVILVIQLYAISHSFPTSHYPRSSQTFDFPSFLLRHHRNFQHSVFEFGHPLKRARCDGTGPYLHMASGVTAGAGANVRRRVGPMPGPSI